MHRSARATGRAHNHGVEGLGDEPLVMDVGAGDLGGQRDAAPVGQDVALDAAFRAVRGVGAGEVPPFGAFTMALSRGDHFHWMPRLRSYNLRSLENASVKTPAAHHSWKRRWHVEPEPKTSGRAFHWQPVRSRYTMPDMTSRSGIGGRPRSVFFRRAGIRGGELPPQSFWDGAEFGFHAHGRSSERPVVKLWNRF